MQWNVTKIRDYKKICFDARGNLSPITEQVILFCKKTGIPSLSMQTAEEFIIRMEMIKELVGSPLRRPDGSSYDLDLQDVAVHIGLKTDVEELSEARFYRKLLRYLRDKAIDNLDSQKEEFRQSG